MASFEQKGAYNMPILFPIEPEQFWNQIRLIVREEIQKIKLPVSAPDSANILETPGLTYKPLLKMAELCELFQVSKPTIYDWVKKGMLKPFKVNSRVYFLRQDVDVLMQQPA